MLVDANVWISAAIQHDSNHQASNAWQSAWLRRPSALDLPVLVLAEVGGAMSRLTGSPSLANAIVHWLATDPSIHLHPLDRRLSHQSAALAIHMRLRGADAVYVALAAELGLPLVTWDQEILTRAAGIVDVLTPDQVPI